MAMDVNVVAGELAALQRNRGLQSGDLRTVGPALSHLTGFLPGRGDSARQSMIRQLVRAAHDLPPDLRLVFLRACAVRADDPNTLQRRLAGVGAVIDRSERVVRRRLDQANLLVAERLLAAAKDDRGWFLGQLLARVDFREPMPVYRADYQLVVTAPSLSRVTEMISLPSVGEEVAPRYEVAGATRLAESRRIQRQTWEFSLELDRLYACGEVISYSSALYLSSRQDAPPMSVMAPRRDCWRFRTTVHLGDLAEAAWVLNGVSAPTVSDETPTGQALDLVASPIASAEFRDLTPGLVYGLRWRWKDGRP